jgi:hypothetical protein
MESKTNYEPIRTWAPTGLKPAMNSAEREAAWLKAGMGRSYTHRFDFLMVLMKLNDVVIDGKHCRQYF